MEIVVRLEIAYGHKRFYPVNENAETLLELLDRCSFTEKQLKLCAEKGWKVDVIQPKYTFE